LEKEDKMSKTYLKGITLEINGKTDKLANALEDVNKKSKEIETELKEVNKLLKFDPKNSELLAQKQKLLGDAISTNKEKLEVLKRPKLKLAMNLQKARFLKSSIEHYKEKSQKPSKN
jgi:phage-related minor tail protein